MQPFLQVVALLLQKTTNTTIKEDENKSTIIIANAMTAEELALEQRKTIDAARSRR